MKVRGKKAEIFKIPASEGWNKEKVEDFYTNLLAFCTNDEIEFSLGAEGYWVEDD